VLALVTEGLLALLQRALTPAGLKLSGAQEVAGTIAPLVAETA
jgi:hypothetical protein